MNRDNAIGDSFRPSAQSIDMLQQLQHANELHSIFNLHKFINKTIRGDVLTQLYHLYIKCQRAAADELSVYFKSVHLQMQSLSQYCEFILFLLLFQCCFCCMTIKSKTNE